MVKEEYPARTISFMLWPDKLLEHLVLYFISGHKNMKIV